ncbi:MAG: 30S ribosomal protein S15 [Candidatus Woesearchaeota archaeon]
MARMYTGKKGSSGSVRPAERKNPVWIRYKPIEVEMLIAKFAKEGKSSSEIGLLLRDTYGIPDVKALLGKSITQVLESKKMKPEIPEDLMNLIRKSVKLKAHLEENKHDNVSKRGLTITESKIRRLVKYYKSAKRIPENWTYDPEKIKLMIQ